MKMIKSKNNKTLSKLRKKNQIEINRKQKWIKIILESRLISDQLQQIDFLLFAGSLLLVNFIFSLYSCDYETTKKNAFFVYVRYKQKLFVRFSFVF